MVIKTKYHCPTCTKSYDTEEEAEMCKQEHKVFMQKWAVCEKCGKGYCIEEYAYGESIGRRHAEEHERECGIWAK